MSVPRRLVTGESSNVPIGRGIALVLLAAAFAHAQPERVLVVQNDSSSISKAIAQYYVQKRAIPAKNVCHIRSTDEEGIMRDVFDDDVVRPITNCLRKRQLVESIFYIVTTAGVPLRIHANGPDGLQTAYASVDSELTLLYTDIKTGKPHTLQGSIPNPFFGKRDREFTHEEFPIYLVTRIAAYDLAGAKQIVDRSLQATNRGKFVFDLKGPEDEAGNDWLRNAAILLPKDRVVLDETTKPVYDQTDVIGYASWGSNDRNHDRRFLGFHWLPGAIMTEYVSTDARTFGKPPDKWVSSMEWNNQSRWFYGSPQSMTADYILEGASGASGHVYEPYLHLNPRPDVIFPAYYSGRNLAESYYLGIPALSWENIVVGDPLCSLGKPSH